MAANILANHHRLLLRHIGSTKHMLYTHNERNIQSL